MSEYQGTFKRYEKKYLVTQQQYNALAKVFAARMVPDRFAESTISNIYYDTPDFRLIRRSLDRPAYKEKLRLRTYRTPGADTEGLWRLRKNTAVNHWQVLHVPDHQTKISTWFRRWFEPVSVQIIPITVPVYVTLHR